MHKVVLDYKIIYFH